MKNKQNSRKAHMNPYQVGENKLNSIKRGDIKGFNAVVLDYDKKSVNPALALVKRKIFQGQFTDKGKYKTEIKIRGNMTISL